MHEMGVRWGGGKFCSNTDREGDVPENVPPDKLLDPSERAPFNLEPLARDNSATIP